MQCDRINCVDNASKAVDEAHLALDELCALETLATSPTTIDALKYAIAALENIATFKEQNFANRRQELHDKLEDMKLV